MLRLPHDGIALNEAFSGESAIIHKHACALGCEGIVSKRLGSPYRAGRSAHWVKVKNPAAPAVKGEAEEEWSGKRARGEGTNHIDSVAAFDRYQKLYLDTIHSFRREKRTEWRPFFSAARTLAIESQGFIAEDVSDDLEGYKAITCLACQRTHLVNPTTGKVLGVDDE